MYEVGRDADRVFESIPKSLNLDFVKEVEVFYMQQVLDRPNARGGIFIVNMNPQALLREFHTLANPAFDMFLSTWFKVVITQLPILDFEGGYFDDDVLDIAHYLERYQRAMFEDHSFAEAISNLMDEDKEIALMTLALDVIKALKTSRLPHVIIDDPQCIEHVSFSFVPASTIGSSGDDTNYLPLYYIYPEMKLYVPQREVW